MKALLLGRDGQVATEILRRAGAHGIEVEALEVPELDFTDPEGAAALVRGKDCDVIINAAAYTAVDKAESEEKLAQLINADGPGAVAKVAAEKGIPFLHISTDYVFDGSGEARFTTDDPTGPLGVYGATKLDGERQVAAAGGWHAILRTSWVFSAHGGNFVKTMLRLGADRDKLTIVADQVGGPTAAADIAEALLAIAKAGPEAEGGLFHFAGVPDASWADFAREIFAQAGVDCAVEDIPTSAYPTPAARPLNSRLDCSRLTRTHGIEPPNWKAALAEVLSELGATKPN
ncbi:dTDP-4-dehydrorhamnose reductase [Aliiruegeria sabulilitoris]|uniref:dTDP-4-dehydrorhamnose reductase n=1 Tax=Aliiruegeria sabulilitoris TaxID=1510458 RepID=UPI00082DA092|nr:dTDP-4-dehydrorhamnose reductase [Aliiruegeria sabulilitoris]NDR55562.1 dTDP-4-dehydrorhamnose reductase [Pseudoruegeria sp. M32A2M]